MRKNSQVKSRPKKKNNTTKKAAIKVSGNIYPPDLSVIDTGTVLGRAAFAEKTYSKGEIVEMAPVILLDYPFEELVLPVQRVVYNWSKLCDASEKFAFVLGYGSIYNHADDPNMRYSANQEKQALIYTAIRVIKKGEQLTVSYNQVPEGAEPRKTSWFVTNDVDKIEIIP